MCFQILYYLITVQYSIEILRAEEKDRFSLILRRPRIAKITPSLKANE